MRRARAAAGLLAGVALAGIAPAAGAAGAEGGPIRTGEHPGFTRVVLLVEPTTEWSLETGPGLATVFFPGRRIAFDASGVWERIPRARVTSIAASVDADGARVRLGLGCDCRITASFVGARRLALDVLDRGAAAPAAATVPAAAPTAAEAPAETAAARTAREEAAVASAEAALIANLVQAADQGVVVMLPEGEATPATAAAPAPTAPRARPAASGEGGGAAGPALAAAGPVAAETQDEAQTGEGADDEPASIAALAGLDQIETISVYDRDGAALAAGVAPAPPAACLPDADFDLGAWGGDAPLYDEAQALLRRLVGEFDKPDPEALRDLARLYLRRGFGAEAESLLTGFGADLPDEPLLRDLARALDARPVAADGPLALAEACPGAHGLWLAVGGAAPAFRDAENFAGVQAAFADLPVDLRVLVGPRLAGRLLDAGRAGEARLIEITATRAGGLETAAAGGSDALALVAARIDAAEGKPEKAAAALRALAESGSPLASEALAALTRLALDQGYAIPDRLLLDLRAAALVQRGDPREAALRALVVEALAARGALPEAVAEAAAAGADMPAEAARFAALAVAEVAAADPATGGPAAYAAAAIAAEPWFPDGPEGDAARRATAARLTDAGLPNAGLDLLGPALGRGDPDTLRLAAAAELALGRPDAVLALLGELPGAAAAELRATALARRGAPADAVATLEAAGAGAAAASYAWASGDWPRAAAATADPNRAAMAAYMAARAGAPALAAGPEAAAFAAPLPNLARPSLAAARDLIERGPEIGAVLDAAIAPEAETEAGPGTR